MRPSVQQLRRQVWLDAFLLCCGGRLTLPQRCGRRRASVPRFFDASIYYSAWTMKLGARKYL